jgi:hypothetical protein
MDGQMTIFDYLKSDEEDLETLPIEYMIKRVEEATGLNFMDSYKLPSGSVRYEAKIKKVVFTIGYDRALWKSWEGKRFISAGYMVGTRYGSDAPYTSLKFAIEMINSDIKHLKEIGEI